MAIFAPILKDIIPNDYISQECKIYFDILPSTNISEIQQVEIKIVNYKDNQRINLDNNLVNFKINNYINLPIGYITDYENIYKLQIRFKNNNEVSDWSNIVILKNIIEPTLELNESNIINQSQPIFTGKSYFGIEQKPSCNGEYIEQFKFDLYSGNKLIESSGWILKDSNNLEDSYQFNEIFENNKNYSINYSIKTNNGYIGHLREHSYSIITNEQKINNIILSVDDSSMECIENGYIGIFITSTIALTTGNYRLLRSSEKNNYNKWEELQLYNFENEFFNNLIIYKDYTIKNHTAYKYALQQIFDDNSRSALLFEQNDPIRYIDFEYSFLIGDGVQLKIKYDNTINNIKRNLQQNKIDTINSRFPSFIRNGVINYLEFPISGLISLSMDDNNNFFKKDGEGYYYKNELVFTEREKEKYSTNLTNNNIYLEKIFRDKVEDFLNNGHNKLFKSPTEGNIIVNLMNISLTPNQTLGKMIYSFSATAYQTAETTIKNFINMGIINKNNLITQTVNQPKKIAGQIIAKSNQEIIDLIQKNHIDYTITNIISLSFEAPLKENLNLNENKIELTIKEKGAPEKKVLFFMNRKYNLKTNNLESIKSSSQIIVNYICEVQKNLVQTFSIKASTPTKIKSIGQISGFFKEGDPQNMTQNILEEIKKNICKKIIIPDKENEGLEFNYNPESNTYLSADNNYKFTFINISNLTVNVANFTTLLLKQFNHDEQFVMIGPTKEYNLEPMEYNLESLKFEQPSEAIINYTYIGNIIQNINQGG